MANGQPVYTKNSCDLVDGHPLFKQQFDLVFPAGEFCNFGEAALRPSEFLPSFFFPARASTVR
jgi:hypothetical protein